MKITLLVDNPDSWFMPYTKHLEEEVRVRGHTVSLMHDAASISSGDCAFFLSCEKIIPAVIRSKNTHNLVVHSSALPEGKGWSPLTWQILEGKQKIPTSLFEAVDTVDAGPVYYRENIIFEGHELLDEMHAKQAGVIANLVLRFLDSYPNNKAEIQEGAETFYRRRTPADSELDPGKTIAEEFDKLRVVDNEKYPAFFTHRGHTYIVKISKKQ